LIFRRTEGIVLRATDYSNTSRIATVYTRDYGKVRLLAKGARRKKSDFLRILEPFSLLEIVYIESRRSLHTFKEAHLIDSFLGLRDRLGEIARALFFLSMIDRTQPDEDPDPAVFELLSDSLFALERVPHPENVAIVFQLHLLQRFGRLPSLATCGRCASPLRANTSYDPASGYLLCGSCARGKKPSLSGGTLEALRRLADTPPNRSGRIRLSKGQHAEIAPILGAMFRASVETEFPAVEVVNALLQ